MDDAKAAVMRLYQAYGTGDAAAIGDCLTDDVVWIAPPGNATQVAVGQGSGEEAGAPYGSNTLGKAEILGFMANDFARLFRDVRNEFRMMVAEGDTVVTEARMSATLANGRPYVNDYCFIYRVRDGRVAEVREYMDTRGGWAQVFGGGPAGALI